MTILQDASEWLSPVEWRMANGYLPLAVTAASERVDALGRPHWDPLKHPRGRDGRFIQEGGTVKVFDSLKGGKVVGTGTVQKIDNAGIHVTIGGRTQIYDKAQIATIPQGAVRLDRSGNVHPHDRELPDMHGKLMRHGDRVKTQDGHEGHVHLVGEDGRIAVKRDDGKIAARRVEHVERLDHPNPVQVRPHERAHLDQTPAHVAHTPAQEPAVPAAHAPPAPSGGEPPRTPGHDAHGHPVPAGWTKGLPDAQGREVYTKPGYRVTLVNDPRYPANPNRYKLDRVTGDGKVIDSLGTPGEWHDNRNHDGDPFHIPGDVNGLINASEADNARQADIRREDAQRRLKPTREHVKAALDHFAAKPDTHAALRHGSESEVKQAIGEDTHVQSGMRRAATDALGRDVRQPHQREEENHLEVLHRAQRHGVAGEPAPLPVAPRAATQGRESIPADLRSISMDKIISAAKGQDGKEVTLGNFTIRSAGGTDGTGTSTTTEGIGANDTYFVTDKRTREQFVVKRDALSGERGAAAEAQVSQLLTGTGYYGAAHVEIHPSDSTAVISTFAGSNTGTTERTLVGRDARTPDVIYKNLADPSELTHARIINAGRANPDRHGGNAFWGRGADGKDHLLLFDHGQALNSRLDPASANNIAIGQKCAYRNVLAQHLHTLGEARSVTEIQQTAQRVLVSVRSQSWPNEAQRQIVLQRLEEIANDPGQFHRTLLSPPPVLPPRRKA